MKLNNLYDFDKTILRKDGMLMFYFYNLRKKPFLFWHFFVMAFVAMFCFFKIFGLEKLKETMLFPLKSFKNREEALKDFSIYATKFCNEYYLKQMQKDDVVCSASPTFLVKAIMQNINPDAKIIGSKISLTTLKFLEGEKNCKGPRKIDAMKKYFNTDGLECENAYSDSLSDIYLFNLAKNKAFLIVKGKPVLYMENGKVIKKCSAKN